MHDWHLGLSGSLLFLAYAETMAIVETLAKQAVAGVEILAGQNANKLIGYRDTEVASGRAGRNVGKSELGQAL